MTMTLRAASVCALLALVLGIGTLAGCDCSGPPDGGEGSPCDVDGDCNTGLLCRDGACHARPDGGDRGDGGGTGFDAGMVCPATQTCGAACCAPTEECILGACEAMCSGLRCGPAMTCCASGDLCIEEACVTPGDPCVESIDCPLDAYCDVALGRCLPRTASRCEYHPPAGVFTPEEQWAWTGSSTAPGSVHVMMAPTVGDLDGDAVPEVVFNTYTSGTSYGGDGVLRIVRGDTGAEVRSVTAPVVCPEHGIALGDLNADGVPEIVTMLTPCSGGVIAAFEPDGSVFWLSHDMTGAPFAGNFQFGAPTIADLEGDGMAEVIIGGAVIEADGTLRFDAQPGAASNCCATVARSPLSGAYDIDGDGDLEVIAGNAVYQHDGTPVWSNPALVDGYIAVADFFADGVLDIAVVHQGSVGSDEGYVSIRRATDGMVLFGPEAMPGGGRGGPPTVADFDGDDLPEIGVAGGSAYAVFDPDGPTPVLWSQTTQDTSSNITGSSVFDFDGDGRAEVVYNDECYMRVYNGADGSIYAQVAQHSHTLVEYPLIVDVDADGNAEIVFAGNSEVNRCDAIPSYDGLRSGIRVFRDGADNWVGTRTVWNQHTYHITNVRQDLSIPAGEQPNFQRFNNFRQNSQSFDAPNLVPAGLAFTPTGCPPDLELAVTVRNVGAVTVGAGLPVTFYLGTPAAPIRALGTVRTLAPIAPGAEERVTVSGAVMIGEQGMGMPWFVRVDDVGDGTGEENECIETDNEAESTYDCNGIG